MGKFILTARKGNYEFSFIATNGDRIAGSTLHITKSAAQEALIEARRSSATMQFYKKKEHDGQYYFELRSKNGILIVTSEKFLSPDARDYAISILKHEAEQATLTEVL